MARITMSATIDPLDLRGVQRLVAAAYEAVLAVRVDRGWAVRSDATSSAAIRVTHGVYPRRGARLTVGLSESDPTRGQATHAVDVKVDTSGRNRAAATITFPAASAGLALESTGDPRASSALATRSTTGVQRAVVRIAVDTPSQLRTVDVESKMDIVVPAAAGRKVTCKASLRLGSGDDRECVELVAHAAHRWLKGSATMTAIKGPDDWCADVTVRFRGRWFARPLVALVTLVANRRLQLAVSRFAETAPKSAREFNEGLSEALRAGDASPGGLHERARIEIQKWIDEDRFRR